MRVREVRDGRRGDYARAGRIDPGITQPADNLVGHPSARFARVLANDYAARAGGKMMTQRAANSIHRFFIQRIFAGNAADSVRAKKLPQVCSCYFVFTTEDAEDRRCLAKFLCASLCPVVSVSVVSRS